MIIDNTWVLEYSFSQNCFVAITKKEQIVSNRNCLLENIPHDFIPINEFETKELLEEEAKFIISKMNSNPTIKATRFFSNN